jgi:iron(III) transport system substrate-binding protein
MASSRKLQIMNSRIWLVLCALLLAGLSTSGDAVCATPAAYRAPPELVAAAQKEGHLTLYTTNFLETEQSIAKLFNARFPGISIEIVRAPGGSLITRMRAENATGQLSADVADLSDRMEAVSMIDLFAPYAPPNADDYLPGSRTGDRLWPRIQNSWVIAYNPAIISNPPAAWRELVRPDYAEPGIGLTVAIAGGGPWTLAMFQRQVLGEGYWSELAAAKPRLFPSGGLMLDALIRGDVAIAPMTTQMVIPLSQDAPVKWVVAKEGTPTTTFAAGMLLKASHPNAARLFLDWSLSAEGQAALLQFGSFSALKDQANPPGLNISEVNVWRPDAAEFMKLRPSWIEEWSRTFGYRQ